MRSREMAVRAAMSRMEELQSFDFEREVPAFIEYLQDPLTSRFAVDGLFGGLSFNEAGEIALPRGTNDPS